MMAFFVMSNTRTAFFVMPKAHHPGMVHDVIVRMMASITVNYMWPKMRDECTKYIQGCEACARVKCNSSDRRGTGRL